MGTRPRYIFFSVNMIYFFYCKQHYCHKLLSYIQAYIHTYMVIYTHDTYRKILLIIANTILILQKKIQNMIQNMISKNELIKDIMKSKSKIITMII